MNLVSYSVFLIENPESFHISDDDRCDFPRFYFSLFVYTSREEPMSCVV